MKDLKDLVRRVGTGSAVRDRLNGVRRRSRFAGHLRPLRRLASRSVGGVRESMRSGITLNRVQRDDGLFDLILATIERSEVQARDDHQTGIIRLPSWDARLEGIEAGVLQEFDRQGEKLNRFLLIVQTDRWEFEANVSHGGTMKLGNIEPKSVSIPNDG